MKTENQGCPLRRFTPTFLFAAPWLAWSGKADLPSATAGLPGIIVDHSQWAAWAAVQSHAIGVHAVERLWHEGNGQTRPGFKAIQFLQQNGDAMRRLHTWDAPLLGPATRSEDTGAQEDQLFHVGAESLFDPGLGWPRYLAALKLHAERPCNHREADGRPLDPDAHPDLRRERRDECIEVACVLRGRHFLCRVTLVRLARLRWRDRSRGHQSAGTMAGSATRTRASLSNSDTVATGSRPCSARRRSSGDS